MLSRVFFALATAILAATAHAIVDVEVEGGDDALIENIRNHIGEISEVEQQRPRLLHKKLDNEVRDATQALGYYEATFTYSLDGNALTIKIEPGEAVLWGEPRFEVSGDAAQLRELKELLANNPFHKNLQINHATYDTFKRHVLDVLQENGFLDAHYAQSQLLIDIEQHRATPLLRIDAGERYRFDEVEYSGSELAPDVLENLSPIERDSYYNKRTLSKLQRNLQQSRYFREIDVRTEKNADHYLMTNVHLGDAPRHLLGIGTGYGTDTGPRVKFRWERPRITERGHKLATNLEVSQLQQFLKFEYHIPLKKPLDESLNFTASWEHKEIQDTLSTIGSAGFFFSDRYAEVWTANYGASIYNESYEQGSEPRQHTTYLAPEINFTQLVLPEGVDPLSGRKAWFSLLGSTPSLGADTNFLRANAGYKQIFNPFGQQLLIGRVELGAISTSSIELIPASQRFFTGGDQTVRGYDYESLATTDANGELIGGRYLNVASAEYSFKVADRWRAAVFTDTGRAFNNRDEPWHKSIGIGARWLSPVGQIRVDFAVPIDDEEKGWRLHIFIGPPL